MADRAFAETGLQEAMARLEQRLRDHPTDPSADPLISLGEALGWLYALDWYHRLDRQQPTSADAETEAGLIYARGKLLKGLLDVALLVTRPGTMMTNRPGPKAFMPSVHQFRWAPLQGLKGRGGDRGEQEYARHVQGQPAYPPLEAAARFITGLP